MNNWKCPKCGYESWVILIDTEANTATVGCYSCNLKVRVSVSPTDELGQIMEKLSKGKLESEVEDD